MPIDLEAALSVRHLGNRRFKVRESSLALGVIESVIRLIEQRCDIAGQMSGLDIALLNMNEQAIALIALLKNHWRYRLRIVEGAHRHEKVIRQTAAELPLNITALAMKPHHFASSSKLN